MSLSNVEVLPNHMKLLAKGYGYYEEKYELMPDEIHLTPPASSIDATPSQIWAVFWRQLRMKGAICESRWARNDFLWSR